MLKSRNLEHEFWSTGAGFPAAFANAVQPIEHQMRRRVPCPLQPNWLVKVKRSASVTGFVLAEETHQTEMSFRQFSIDIVLYL